MPPPAISFEHVTFGYDAGPPVLRDVSLAIDSGDVFAIVGGAGKSHDAATHQPARPARPRRRARRRTPDAGADPIQLRRRVGSHSRASGSFFLHMTVAENVSLLARLDGWSVDRIRQRVDELIVLAGLPSDVAERWLEEISGGQRQRGGGARALMMARAAVDRRGNSRLGSRRSRHRHDRRRDRRRRPRQADLRRARYGRRRRDPRWRFTEQIILGELVAQAIEQRTTLQVERKLNLGGTLICEQALTSGAIDLYVEYSGTALTALFKQPVARDRRAVLETVRGRYAASGRTMMDPLGFNNTFAILIRRDTARETGARTISEGGALRARLAGRLRLRVPGPEMAIAGWRAPTGSRSASRRARWISI